MYSERLASQLESNQPPAQQGFLLMPVAAVSDPISPLQWLYLRMYEEAQKAATPAPGRDLFSVMN
jgi:hypothetical protein